MNNPLPQRVWIFTPAGNICVPDLFEPWYPPGDVELRAVFQYMHAAGIPVAKWNEWRSIIQVERVSEIKSLYNLFALWMFILRWQYEHNIEPTPTDEIGVMVQPWARDFSKYIGLTPEDSAIVCVSTSNASA